VAPPAGCAGGAFDPRAADHEGRPGRWQQSEIGERLEPPAPGRQPERMGREVARGPRVEGERIDRDAAGVALDQKCRRLGVKTGKMHDALIIVVAELRRGDVPVPAAQHGDAGTGRDGSVRGLERQEIVGRQLGVRARLGARADVDHDERQDQLLERDLVDREAAIGEVERRIDVGAAVLDQMPAAHVVAVRLERGDALEREGVRIEARKIRAQRMGQVEAAAEASAEGRIDRYRRTGCGRPGRRAPPAQRLTNSLQASRRTHASRNSELGNATRTVAPGPSGPARGVRPGPKASRAAASYGLSPFLCMQPSM
jgi:hypothetical protein